MIAEDKRGPIDCPVFAGPHADLFVDGIAVRDGFLPQSRIRALIDCADVRRAHGDFVGARVGAGRRLRRREEIRGDSTCWLLEPLFEEERELLSDLERLRLDLNREGFLGLFDLELHYAWYPPGAGYARHFDRPQGRDQRQVSFVLYLNEAWTRDDGGELRLFSVAGRHRDIEPLGGRLVYFLTAEQEHAVLPARRHRWSIAGWFRNRGRW